MRRNHVAGLLLAAGLMPGFLLAHEGHKVMGTVTAVDANRVEVKDKDGKTVSIALTTATKFMRPAAKPCAAVNFGNSPARSPIPSKFR